MPLGLERNLRVEGPAQSEGSGSALLPGAQQNCGLKPRLANRACGLFKSLAKRKRGSEGEGLALTFGAQLSCGEAPGSLPSASTGCASHVWCQHATSHLRHT